MFVDDFATDVPLGAFPEAVSAKWGAYPYPWNDSSKNGTYSAGAVVSVSDGVLNKDIHTEGRRHLVAALMPKVSDAPEHGILYGRFAVRFRADIIPGYKVAWMLWPDSGTNIRGSRSGTGGNGEIDFPERDLDSPYLGGFVHHQDGRRNEDQERFRVPFDGSAWHTTVIEWSPDLVVFTLDGVEIGRTTTRVPNTSMHWILQTETELTSKAPSAAARGNVQVDWVAAWAYDPTTATETPETTVPAGREGDPGVP